MTKNEDKIKPCKIIKRAKNRDGYAVLLRSSYGEGTEHRYVYKKAHGDIPKGMVVRHKCNNPGCIELTHLELGTQAQNVWDSVESGTHKNPSFPGESNPMSTLTVDEVLEIRNRYATGYWSQQQLADLFGVNRVTITNIVNRKTWKHI